MKTRLAVLLTLAFLVVGLPAPAQAATEIAVDGLRYSVDGTEATLLGPVTYHDFVGADLVIPGSVSSGGTTYTVVAVGDNAFVTNGIVGVTFPASVRNIGSAAFGVNSLTSLTLPSGLTTIGEGAFVSNGLTSVTIPDSVTTIGPSAFAANQLTSVRIPAGLTTITRQSFNSNHLTSLTIPSGVTAIEQQAFAGNTIDDVRFTGPSPTLGGTVFGTSNPVVRYSWSDGAPQTAGGYTSPTWNGFSTIPVATVSFDSNGATTADPADQEVDVDGTSTATEPTDPTHATKAFTGWFTSSAATGTPWDFSQPLTGDLDLYAGFADTATVDGFTYDLDPATSTATVIDHVGQTTVIDIPATFAAFGTTWTVTAIGDRAFNEGFQPWITTLTIPEGIVSIGQSAFEYQYLSDPVVIPDSVTTIGSAAFANTGVADLTLGSGLRTIGASAFAFNANLDQLVIPAGVTSIGSDALRGVDEVTMLGAKPATGSRHAFDTGATVRHPWRFGASQVAGGYPTPTWSGATTIAFATVRFDGNGATSADPASQEVDVDGTSTATKPTDPTHATKTFTGWFTSSAATGTPWDFSQPLTGDLDLYAGFEIPQIAVNGLRYSVEGTSATVLGLVDATNTQDVGVTIPSAIVHGGTTYAVTAIADSAFANGRLGTVTIAGSVRTIGDRAFYSSTLDRVVLNDGLTTIGWFAFSTNRLTDVVIPDSVTSMGQSAFARNDLLRVTLPAGTSQLQDRLFYDNDQLSVVTIPAGVTLILKEVFADMDSLAAVYFEGPAPNTVIDAFSDSHPTAIFRWRFGAGQTAGGYSMPSWLGLASMAVATITFDADGDPADDPVDQDVDVDGTSRATAPPNPVRDGQPFLGWSADGGTTLYDFDTPIAGDLDLVAQFGPTEITGLAPTIDGALREGSMLTAIPGTVTPSATELTYQWLADGAPIAGATRSTLTLGSAQAARRISVRVTATHPDAETVVRTSPLSVIVSSTQLRLRTLPTTIKRGQSFKVVAAGFTPNQTIKIWLSGTIRFRGKADARGVVSATVTFKSSVKPGHRRVRVSGYSAKNKRNRTIYQHIRVTR